MERGTDMNTWQKALGNPPPPIGDCRKLVWLVDRDGMGWIGIRAYHGSDGVWMVSGVREESATVTHWMDLPDRPMDYVEVDNAPDPVKEIVFGPQEIDTVKQAIGRARAIMDDYRKASEVTPEMMQRRVTI